MREGGEGGRGEGGRAGREPGEGREGKSEVRVRESDGQMKEWIHGGKEMERGEFPLE